MGAETTLAELARDAGGRLVGDGGVTVVDVTHDSRQAGPGVLFACVSGFTTDGHRFAPAAVDAGSPALLVERHLPEVRAPQLVVGDVRALLGPVAAAVHGHPADQLTMVGVTGTNGKTTVVHLLGSVLAAHGWRTEILGTTTGPRTTPEAPDLQRQLARWRDAGTEAVAMEVSSHGLALRRVDGTRFDVAVFTNLSRDHLELHATMEEYFAAKARLFTPEMADRAVVNLDDPRGRLLADAASVPTTGFSTADASDVRLTAMSSSFRWRGQQVTVAMGGHFTVHNALAAATAASVLGVDDATVARGLSGAPPVPGRFEAVDAGQPFAVVVDYAHTPDALVQVLEAARRLAEGRVLVVFGAGGDRDPDKRPEMGRAAAAAADVVVLTDDNPRSEDPAAIRAAVEAGMAGAAAAVHVEPDRRAAIAHAIGAARAGDVVVIAGKGHETGQQIGDQVLAFDDRDVARQVLQEASW